MFLKSKCEYEIKGVSNNWMYIIIKYNVRENHQYLRCICQQKFEKIRISFKIRAVSVSKE